MSNKLEVDDIEFRFRKSMAYTTLHHQLHRDDNFGIQREIITKKNADGSFGSRKTYFFMDGNNKEYTDLQELCDDWNEIKNFDDPNNEIIWVKIIKSK